MNALESLEPCPFCGKSLSHGYNAANPLAMCKTPDCFGQKMPPLSLSDPKDVARWNCRPQQHERKGCGSIFG